MKHVQRSLTLLLAVLMLLTCSVTPAFAASKESVVQYGTTGGYLALGDSITRGLGASDDYLDNYYDLTSRVVKGSYSLTVAQAVGCRIADDVTDSTSNYWPVCSSGQTLAGTMDLLGIEDHYYDAEYTHNTAEGCDRYSGFYEALASAYPNVPALVKQASLITIELGMGDVLNRPLVLPELIHSENTAQTVASVVKALYEGYAYWLAYYPVLLEQLQEWNSGAQIVIVGAANFVADLTLTDDTLLPIGSAASSITAQMNQHYRQWAKQYNAIFVDISNVQTAAGENEWGLLSDAFSDNGRVSTHPTVNGYQYIARQILAALPKQTETTKCPTDIVVDLSRYEKVDLVLLDGEVVTGQMDGTVLTVCNRRRNAKNLTVVSSSGGKTMLQTYQLVYHDGYTPYRIYGTSDVGNKVQRVLRTTSSLFSLLRGK